MSGQHFHVHGPHDHELEHAAAHAAPDSHAGQLAVVTAVLATIGALFGYMGGLTQANAGLLKNDAAIRKTEASNQWNYYQAKSGKQNLAELSLELVPEPRRAFYQDEIRRYKAEKNDIKAEAEKLEREAKEFDRRSEEQLHLHHRWAQATTALQVAIAMAAIALLTRKRWSEFLVYGLGAVGLALGGAAWLHY